MSWRYHLSNLGKESDFECLHSPARRSAAIGRLPEVIYLVEIPRAASGWASICLSWFSRSRAPASLNLRPLLVWFSGSESLGKGFREQTPEYYWLDKPHVVRIQVNAKCLRRFFHPIFLKIRFLHLVLALFNLTGQLNSHFELIQYTEFNRELSYLVFIWKCYQELKLKNDELVRHTSRETRHEGPDNSTFIGSYH